MALMVGESKTLSFSFSVRDVCVHVAICVCVFIEKLPGDRAQQYSMARPSPAQPSPARTLTKKLLFSLYPTHITRLRLPKTHCNI